MPLLGAHMSIAGGFYKAVEAAAALGMGTVQIFTHSPSQWAVKPIAPAGEEPPRSGKRFTSNNNQWRAQPLSDADVVRFREALERAGLRRPCAHTSYLINLASSDPELWPKSLDAFVVELERAEALGLTGVVVHPGSCVAASEEDGLQQIVRALDAALERTAGISTEIWLETTAGQGTSLGHRFEHLQYLLESVADNRRLGVCVDSCHIHAAGYGLGTPEEYRETMEAFDRTVGLDRIRAFHLNDSKRERGSRVDRHEHIGEGRLGRKPFRFLLTDPRFAGLPMYLETPKGKRDGKDLDAINLATLRRLARARGR